MLIINSNHRPEMFENLKSGFLEIFAKKNSKLYRIYFLNPYLQTSKHEDRCNEKLYIYQQKPNKIRM